MEHSMETVLEAFLNKDNATRKGAEQYYFSILDNPNGQLTICQELLRVLSDLSQKERVRYMALALFRRFVDHTKPQWGGLTDTVPDLEATVKKTLMDVFSHEKKEHLRHLLSHSIAEVAVHGAGHGCADWPDLLSTVFAMTQSDDVSTKQTALFLFDKLAEYGGQKLLAPHADALRPVLEGLLQDADNTVRISAMEATSRFIVNLADDSLRRTFRPVLPTMLKILEAALLEDEFSAKAALNSFTDILAEDPSFMKPYIEQACQTMITITGHEGFENSTRKLGLEFMVCLAEESGGLMRKMRPFIQSTIQLAMEFMCMVSEDPGWGSKSDDEYTFIGDEADGENGDLVTSACSGLDRLAAGVGGKTFWPVFTEVTGPLLSSEDWRQRRAALLAIALVGEGCKKHLAPIIRSIVEGVIGYVADPHPRVRHSAVRALGQLIRDFSDPTTHESMDGNLDAAAGVVTKPAAVRGKGREKLKSIQDAAADIITPAFISALENNLDQPRVLACTCLAIVNLVADGFCEKKHLQGRERDMLVALFNTIEQCPLKTGKQAALICVGLISNILQDEFAEYYSIFVPICQHVLDTYSGKEYIKLRGDALHSFSLIAEAVGREVAGMDAAKMVNMVLLALKNNEFEDSDAFEYLALALVRLGSCLQADFVPYLEFALPLLQQFACVDVDIVTLEGDAPDEDDERVKGKIITSVNLPGMSARSIAIDSQALSIRVGALSSLATMVEDLGVDVPGFWPYTPEAAKAIVHNFSAPFASLREIALSGAQYIMLAALADTEHPQIAQSIFDYILESLIEMVSHERQLEVTLVIAEALSGLCKLSWDSYATTLVKAAPALPVFGEPVNAQLNCARILAEAMSPVETPHTHVVISEKFLEEMCDVVHAFIESSAERRKEVLAQAARNEDADEEDVERVRQALEPEDDFVSSAVDILGYCIKTHGAKMLPLISKELGPFVMGYLQNTDMFMEPIRSAAVCICDDLIEFASPESHVVLDVLTPSLFSGLEQSDSFVRHSAAYGLGVCAMFGGEKFDAYAADAANKLTQALLRPEAKEYENGSATDNCAAALLKIASYRKHLVDADALVDGALSFMPFKYDSIEGRYMHGALIEGLANQDTFWLGADFSRAGKCLSVLANAIVAHLKNMSVDDRDDEDEDDDGDRDPLIGQQHLDMLPGIFAAMKASPMAAGVAALVSSMKPKQQAALAQFGLSF